MPRLAATFYTHLPFFRNSSAANHLSNQQHRAIRRFFEQLLPGVTTSEAFIKRKDFEAMHVQWRSRLSSAGGAIIKDSNITIWMSLDSTTVYTLSIAREPIPLTKSERSLFRSFHLSIIGLMPESDTRAGRASARIASRYAIGNLIIARHLRGPNGSNFWTPALILSELQDLALQKYEGQPCSSGIVYTSRPEELIPNLPSDKYDLMSSRLKFYLM